MKPNYKLSLLMALCLISLTSLLNAQTVVTLNVDTSEIDKHEDLNMTCYFTGQPEGVSLEDFTIEVVVGEEITWVGQSTVDDTTVEIKKIKYEKGVKLLDGDDIDSNGDEKFVKANPNNADGYNLLGYSLRNAKRNSEAIFNYKEALRIDPQHRGALEYLGIAYVQNKELPKAKELLVSLEKICGLQCEEYQDLKKAIVKAEKK